MQKRINYSLVFAAMIVVFSSTSATAIKLDDNRIGAISQNCSIIKERLRRIESVGAKSRVYLGTQYESIYSGLMSNFSLRLMRNGIAKQDIANQQAAFQSDPTRGTKIPTSRKGMSSSDLPTRSRGGIYISIITAAAIIR